MSKKGLLRLPLIAILAGLLWSCTAEAVMVTFTWDYDFVADPACSTTVTTNCVKTFVIRDGMVAVASVSAPTLSITVEVPRPYGARSFYATAVTDTNVESLNSNTVTVTVRPAAPKNLR